MIRTRRAWLASIGAIASGHLAFALAWAVVAGAMSALGFRDVAEHLVSYMVAIGAAGAVAGAAVAHFAPAAPMLHLAAFCSTFLPFLSVDAGVEERLGTAVRGIALVLVVPAMLGAFVRAHAMERMALARKLFSGSAPE